MVVFSSYSMPRQGSGLNKMFGGTNAEKKWKVRNKDHVDEYSANYYQTNKEKIHAKRKETRIKNKPNKVLGF